MDATIDDIKAPGFGTYKVKFTKGDLEATVTLESHLKPFAGMVVTLRKTEKSDIIVIVKDHDDNAVTPDTAILYIPSGDVWKEVKRLNPTSNAYTFTDLNAGTYHTEAYKDNMFIGRAENIEVSVGVCQIAYITTLYKRNLEAKVCYKDGSTPVVGATVKVYSRDGHNKKWDYEYEGITNSQGKVTFSSWPTSCSGEKYELKVEHNGYSKTKEPVYVDKDSGSSYSIILNEPALYSLKVIVKNIVGNSLPLSGGTIEVVLYDNEYKPIETKSKTYSGGESSVQVEFDNIADDDYYIEVYNTANTGLKLSEFWGADEVTVSGSTTKDFIRHTQWIKDVKINGENLYGNKIRVNAGEKVHVDITIKNDEGSSKKVKVRLMLDRDKSSNYDFDETHGPVNVQKNGYGYFGYDFSPSQVGTYYFYIIPSGYYNDKYTVTDQHDWYKAFNAIEVLKGYGAWVYGTEIDYITAISDYNSVSSDEKDIKYLFCRIGGLNLENQEVIDYDSSVTNYYKKNLPNCLIYPMLDASGNLGDLSSSELDTLAQSIADEINADSNADGIHLDIEPYDDNLVELVDDISTKTSKPVTVAIGITNPPDELFKSCKIVVLMNYDLATNWVIHGNKAKIKANDFLTAATNAGGYGMIGIPAITTHHEYGYRVNKNDGSTESTGYLMIDYMIPGVRAVEDAIQNVGDEYYVGMSIWSFLNEPVGLYDSGDWKYYPYGISEEEWDFLKGVDAEITSWNVASGTFYLGDQVEATIIVKNTGSVKNIFYVGYSVKDPTGDYLDAPYTSVYLDAGSSNTIHLYWTVPDSPVVGSYGATVAVWMKEFETPIGFLHGQLDLEEENSLFRVGDELLKILPAPYYDQGDTKWCALASTAMILKYYGKTVHPEKIAEIYGVSHDRDVFVEFLELKFLHNIPKEMFENYGLTVQDISFEVKDIKDSLRQGYPIFLGLGRPISHAVVIMGYKETTNPNDPILFINDPSGHLTRDICKNEKYPPIAVPIQYSRVQKEVNKCISIARMIYSVQGKPNPPEGTIYILDRCIDIRKPPFYLTECTLWLDKGYSWDYGEGSLKRILTVKPTYVICPECAICNHLDVNKNYHIKFLIREPSGNVVISSEPEDPKGLFEVKGKNTTAVSFPEIKLDELSAGDYTMEIVLTSESGKYCDRIGPIPFKVESANQPDLTVTKFDIQSNPCHIGDNITITFEVERGCPTIIPQEIIILAHI